MKKAAGFITKYSKLILLLMLAVCIFCAYLITKVEINTDMTKYLSDDSSMKIGVDIMKEELDAASSYQSIRVMFTGLEESEKEAVLARLEAIDYVDSVDYEFGSDDYNKDEYTLYVVNTEYAYSSSEMSSIEKALLSDFGEYELTYHNDDDSDVELPAWVIAVALLLMLAVLFAMCNSWFEPLLFIVTIGVAVAINMGTNVILGSVSNITFTIGAILQLILSMDYSIILMNRYRQELSQCKDKKTAMQLSLTRAFSSVASSGMTTIVGLLMLVFMSFKIGFDLGIVLAKGVAISMLCVFTVLPGLILIFTPIILKSSKKAFDIPLFKMGGGIFKLRKAFVPAFLLLFLAAYILQGNTQIAYSYDSGDPIEDVFVTENSIVMLYSNEDEDKIAALAEYFGDNVNIKSISSYPTLLGKEYTSDEMADAITDLTDEMDISSDMLSMLYYAYYGDDEEIEMTVSDFLYFVSEYVADNEEFAEYLSDDVLDNIDSMMKFADASALTEALSADALANFFDMDSSDVKSMILYYYIQNDKTPTNTMTIAQFAEFIVNELASDADYSAMFDSKTLSEIEQLLTYTDVNEMTASRTYESMAEIMGMDADDMKLLYVYYFAMQSSYIPDSMTISEFVDFLCNDIANNETFASAFDAATLSQMKTLQVYTNTAAIQTQMDAAHLAEFFGMDEADVLKLLLYYQIQNGTAPSDTMTLPVFADFVVNEVAADSTYAAMFDSAALSQMSALLTYTDTALMTSPVDYTTMSMLLDMDSDNTRLLYAYYYMMQADYTPASMTIGEFADFICNDAAENPVFAAEFDEASLTALQYMAQAADSDTSYSYVEMAQLLGMDYTTALLLYAYHDTDSQIMSVQTMNNFILENTDKFVSMLCDNLSSLVFAQQIINNSVAGTGYSYTELANLTGMSVEQSRQLFLLYKSSHGDTSSWTMSPFAFVSFLLSDVASNEAYSSMLDSNSIGQLTLMQTIMASAINKTAFTYSEMAQLFEMDSDNVKMLYTYHDSYTKAASWKLSVQTVINFLTANTDTFASLLGDNLSDLTTAKKIIDSAVAGTSYSYADIAELLEMDATLSRQLYLVYTSRHSDTSSWKISVQNFVDFILSDVLTNEDYAALIDSDSGEALKAANVLIDDVVKGASYTSAQLCELLETLSDDMDESMTELLYLYYAGIKLSDSKWTLSLHTMFTYLADELINDTRFESMLDEELKDNIETIRSELEDGISQLKGENYSILYFSTAFLEESAETTAFINALMAYADENLSGDYYLIGNSIMIYEMQNGFDSEMLLITLLTAISIFIVVALTFKSLLIPALLVLVVQCGVYITVSTCGLMGYSIYYLALLIVQCILMGATIDYGILFTNYYRESRMTLGIRQAVIAAYKGAGHTILTSGLIMILVTGVIGFSPANETIRQICLTISIGTLSAVVLIVLLLPGMLMALDKFVIKKNSN